MPPHVAHRTHPTGGRARHVCNASQERATGRLQELPRNLLPVSLLQVDACHHGTAPGDYTGEPCTYPIHRLAGFRPARGCRDNVSALRWFIQMILRGGRQAVITCIDYSAAFDTESHVFLDEALAETAVGSTKVHRIVQAIFAAAT